MSETGDGNPTSNRRGFLRRFVPGLAETPEVDPKPKITPPIDLNATTDRRDFIRNAVTAASAAGVATIAAKPAIEKFAGWVLNTNDHPEDRSAQGVNEVTDAPSPSTTAPEQLSRVVTPEERLKEFGLDRFQGFFDTYKYYAQKYGPAITDWSPGASFPIAKELIDTLLSVAEPANAPNEANVSQWRDGWGSEKGGAATAAHERIKKIQISGDQVFQEGIPSVLSKIADIVPAVVLAYPDSVDQKMGGGGYSGDNIGTSYYAESPSESIATAIHEGMHSVLNTRILALKRFLDPEAFATYITTYLDGVGRSIDMFLDTPYEQLTYESGLRLYVNEPDIAHYSDRQDKIRELFGRFPHLFNPEEFKKEDMRLQENYGIDPIAQIELPDGTEPEIPGPINSGTVTNRRNYYSQLIGRKSRELRLTDPDNPFLAEQIVQEEIKDLTTHYAHQFVFKGEAIMSQNPSEFERIQKNVWNEFMKAASPLQNPTLEGFQSAIDKYLPEEERRLFNSFGLTEIASSPDTNTDKHRYQIYALPGDKRVYYVSYVDDSGNRFVNLVTSEESEPFEDMSVSISQEEYKPQGVETPNTIEATRLNYKSGDSNSSLLLRAVDSVTGTIVYDLDIVPATVRVAEMKTLPKVSTLESGTTTQFHWRHKNTNGDVLSERDVNLTFYEQDTDTVAIDTGKLTNVDDQFLKFEIDYFNPRLQAVVRDRDTKEGAQTEQFYPDIFNTGSLFMYDGIAYSDVTQEYIMPPQQIMISVDGWGFRLGEKSKVQLDAAVAQYSAGGIALKPVFVETTDEKNIKKRKLMLKIKHIDFGLETTEELGYIEPMEIFSIEQAR